MTLNRILAIALLVALAFAIYAARAWLNPPKAAATEPSPQAAAFRAAVVAEWKSNPPGLVHDIDDLCRKVFLGSTIKQANATLRGAGQLFDLEAVSQAVAVTPPGTAAFGGGFTLAANLVGHSTFNVILFVDASHPQTSAVSHVQCAIRNVYL